MAGFQQTYSELPSSQMSPEELYEDPTWSESFATVDTDLCSEASLAVELVEFSLFSEATLAVGLAIELAQLPSSYIIPEDLGGDTPWSEVFATVKSDASSEGTLVAEFDHNGQSETVTDEAVVDASDIPDKAHSPTPSLLAAAADTSDRGALSDSNATYVPPSEDTVNSSTIPDIGKLSQESSAESQSASSRAEQPKAVSALPQGSISGNWEVGLDVIATASSAGQACEQPIENNATMEKEGSSGNYSNVQRKRPFDIAIHDSPETAQRISKRPMTRHPKSIGTGDASIISDASTSSRNPSLSTHRNAYDQSASPSAASEMLSTAGNVASSQSPSSPMPRRSPASRAASASRTPREVNVSGLFPRLDLVELPEPFVTQIPTAWKPEIVQQYVVDFWPRGANSIGSDGKQTIFVCKVCQQRFSNDQQKSNGTVCNHSRVQKQSVADWAVQLRHGTPISWEQVRAKFRVVLLDEGTNEGVVAPLLKTGELGQWAPGRPIPFTLYWFAPGQSWCAKMANRS